MKTYTFLALTFLALILASVGSQVHAQGPGLGNISYNSSELFKRISVIKSPKGHGNVAMVNGYLMVIYSSDGGGTSRDGGIEFWDVSNPRKPVLAVRHDNNNTHGLREAHGFAFSSSYPGDYMVAQAVEGIQFWDLSDPFNITLLDYMRLPGISQGDYSGAWWVFWQAPYVYVAGMGSGLYVIDATDPANPVLLNRVQTSQMGGLNPGMVYALGNLLLVAENQSSSYATMDISDPANPTLIEYFDGKSGYSHIFAAGKILSSGGNGDPSRMYIHNVSHNGDISFVGSVGSGLGNGGYGSYQDGFFHSGFSSKYAKFNVASLDQIGTGSSQLSGRDEDFGQVLGNLVFVGNDHGQGSALVAHQTRPDTRGPDVHWVHPRNGASNMALTSRVGVSMSDNIDIKSVDSTTFIVRPKGGSPLSGKYSVQMGLVNFTPDSPLQPGATYEVVVTGMRDYAGNRGGTFTSEFSTTGGPVSSDGLISNISVASGADYQIGTFTAGQPVYIDRDYVFDNQHPTAFEDQEYIRTANNDKAGTGSRFLTFSLSADATVYVLYDSRAAQVPGWLGNGGWTKTSDTVGSTDVDRVVYRKGFPAGNVVLGGNADAPMNGAGSMYSVLAIPSDGASPRCTVQPSSPTEVNTAVAFTAEIVPGSGPVTYLWAFGDSITPPPPSTSSTASHTYSTPGRYRVVLTVQNSSGGSSCSLVQVIHNPITSPAPTASSAIIHSGTRSFNVNPDNDTVTAINESSLTKAWEAPVGKNPQTLAEAPNGDIWVVNQGDASISIIKASDGSLLDSIPLPYASRPYGIAFSPDGSAAYVTLQGTGRLLKLNPSGDITGDIDIGPKPRGIAISGDSRRILVTRFVSLAGHGEVREVDAATFSLVRTFDLASDPGPDTEASGRGVPNYIGSVSITPDGKRAFAPSKKDNVARGLFRDGQALTFESRVRAIVSQIDLENNAENLAGRIDLNDRNMPQSMVFSPVGDIFFVAAQGNNLVEVYDANSLALLGGMNTGLAPQGMAFNSDASKLYVHNFMSRTVSVFDTTNFIKAINNSATKLAEISTVANETLSPQVLSGKQVFYNAADPRMSRDGYISCASCHVDGGNDGQVWDFTQSGEGFRNTIALTGRSGLGHGNLHWTANFDEVQDFENDIRKLFGGVGFLSDSDFNNTLNPLGNPKAGLSPELDALAAYLTSLTTTPPSPYRNPDGTLTIDGQAGRQIFADRNCQSCHAGPSFTDKQRHDVGTVQASSGRGMGQPLDGVGFETPTLKGIWDTAPYLHNGQAGTLQEVLSNPEHGNTAGLTTAEIDQLIAYLSQIDENEPPVGGTTNPAALMLPGRLEAENYKAGGEGVGYHDTTLGNSGGQHRSDDVDIQATTDAGGGFNTGWTRTGEWLAFDVSVDQTGAYDFTARVASAVAGGKSLHVEVDGVNVTGPLAFTDSSGWQSWRDVTVTGVHLTAGLHELRLVMDSDFFNVNYLEVALSANTAPDASIASPPEGASFLTTDTISFSGSATDLEDGSLTQGSLVWVSSIDGQIGTGQMVQVSLSSGVHTITLTVTDSVGSSDIATVTVTIVNLVYGDATGDGQFTGEDIYLVVDWIIGRKPMPLVGTLAFVVADVNGDGVISSADVGLMIARYLGTISKFPVEP